MSNHVDPDLFKLAETPQDSSPEGFFSISSPTIQIGKHTTSGSNLGILVTTPKQECVAILCPANPRAKSKKDSKLALKDDDSKETTIWARNYKGKENVQLCVSWIEISEDPLTRTDQTTNTFWERITRSFLEVIPVPACSPISMKSWWCTIQHDVNKYCGCVTKIEPLNQSGKLTDDQQDDALKFYKELYGKPFKFLRAYHILSKCPKWATLTQQKEKEKRPDHPYESFWLSQSSGTIKHTASVFSTKPLEKSEIKRPMGHKKARRPVKTESELSAMAETSRLMADSAQELAKLTCEQNELLKRQSLASERLANNSLMKKYSSSLDDDGKEYLGLTKKKIWRTSELKCDGLIKR